MRIRVKADCNQSVGLGWGANDASTACTIEASHAAVGIVASALNQNHSHQNPICSDSSFHATTAAEIPFPSAASISSKGRPHASWNQLGNVVNGLTGQVVANAALAEGINPIQGQKKENNIATTVVTLVTFLILFAFITLKLGIYVCVD